MADKKNLDTISSFTPVISSDADHDNQKLIEEKSIEEKTATLDKTNGGSAAAEVLKGLFFVASHLTYALLMHILHIFEFCSTKAGSK